MLQKTIDSVLNGKLSYCKFLSANDSGETGGHQSGILVSKTAREMLFRDDEIANNHIFKRNAHIKWQDDFSTTCTFTWYESKRELRITGFGRGFELLRPEYTGALFVLVKDDVEDYQGFILNTDDDIQEFLEAFGLSPVDTNRIIEIDNFIPEVKKEQVIREFIESLGTNFPTSYEMSLEARMLCHMFELKGNIRYIDPDTLLLKWSDEEYNLFRTMEHARYGNRIKNGFDSVDDFIILANKVLNRRKSRAGKSLEHHLAALFDDNQIVYDAQATTEGNKKPDFLFPSQEAYHDASFDINRLCTLAAKTTCKDRWRQILNEADRLRDKNKYLCTMQQGISSSQMDEMKAEKVVLVVPKPYILSYPKEKRADIWTLSKFIQYIQEIER